MRVLHLTTEFPPEIYGGFGVAVGGWALASARAGIGVGVQLVKGTVGTYYARGDVSPARRSGENFLDQRGILWFESPASDAVDAGVDLLRRWRPDVVHLHTASIWNVAEAMKEQGIPVVFHV